MSEMFPKRHHKHGIDVHGGKKNTAIGFDQ